jgi:hypothetical protein
MSQPILDQQAAINEIAAHGYLQREAEFIYHVCVHSGYFVRPQLRRFLSTQRGKREQLFIQKLIRNQHATVMQISRADLVHIDSKTIYRCLGNENSQNRRRKSTALIRTRLLALDYVLSTSLCYLTSESDKIRFFTEQLSVRRESLPRRVHAARTGRGNTVHYFPDRLPVAVDATTEAVRFIYPDDPKAPLFQFKRYVQANFPFWQLLKQVTIVYVTQVPDRAKLARCYYNDVLAKCPFVLTSDDLRRFFLYRLLVDEGRAHEIPMSELRFYKRALDYFIAPMYESQYRRFRSDNRGANPPTLEPKSAATLELRPTASIGFEVHSASTAVDWVK